MDIKCDTNNKTEKKTVILRIVLLPLLIVISITLGIGGGTVLGFIKEAPEVDKNIFIEKLALTSNIYDKDGKFVEGLHGIENREYVSISKVKIHTQNAFIAIEDERFREHFGVDIKRIFGALWRNIKSGRYDQGASTITQQLIKNTILTPRKELKRKIQEAYLAIKLEREITKDQILEYYLNTIYLGGNAYGIQAASQYYFSKDAEQLSIAESAPIAGLTQSPSKYNPYNNDKTPEVYKDRQILVLSKMLEHNMITKEEFEKAKNEELVFRKRDSSGEIKYPWFVDAVISDVTNDLKSKYYLTVDEINNLLYTGGLKIYTTLDPVVQDIVDKAANDPKYYPTLAKDISVYGKDNIIQPQVAIVINDYKTGEVRAIVGGRGKQPFRSLNRAADPAYARQPGSAMKPLAVYAPAFDLGYAPASVIDDSPFTPEESSMAPGWPEEGPHNYDDRYRGLTTIREGVKWSSNLVAAKLMLRIGPDTSTEYIKNFGISTLVLSGANNDKGAAKALGGLTKGVTPLEMSGAYGVFGNGGVYIEPILYSKVLDREGNVILEKKQESHQVISPQAAYMTIDVLEGVIESGTGSAVRSKGKFTAMSSAGKTGTTEKGADAYFAGLTPYYSGVIWVGHDKPSLSLNLSSANVAWMWGDIMRQIHEGLSVENFHMPDGIVTAEVCRDSGKLPTELCARDPRGSRIVKDIFMEGKVPAEKCDVHTAIRIDILTGKPAGEFTFPFFIKEYVYIKRPYPVDSRVEDYEYQIPAEFQKLPYEETSLYEEQDPGINQEHESKNDKKPKKPSQKDKKKR